MIKKSYLCGSAGPLPMVLPGAGAQSKEAFTEFLPFAIPRWIAELQVFLVSTLYYIRIPLLAKEGLHSNTPFATWKTFKLA